MSVYVDRKTERLYIQFEFEGQTYKKRLPEGSTKKEAEKLETKWKHDLFFAEQLPEEKERVVWERFVEDVYLPYVKANNTREALDKALVICKAATPFFKGMELQDIKPADIERFKATRMGTPTQHGKPRMASTIHREMSIISRIFSLAEKNDLVPYNPVRRVDLPKFDNVQDKILPLHLEEKFLWSMYKLQREICITALYTGLRQKDLFHLTKDKINFETNEVRVKQFKTGRWVTIPLLPKVRDILASRMDNETDLIFPSPRSGKVLTKITNSIKRASDKLGIQLTIRDLRRTFGTRLHENGYDDKTIADLLGHVGLRCVSRYKRGTEIKRKAILSLENLVESTKIPTSGENDLLTDSLEPSKTLVEMRRIELLASALRTQTPTPYIH